MIGLLYLAYLSPILVSAFLVVVKGKGVRGRWLFLVVGPVLAYTIMWVATLVFFAPAWIIITFLAPAVIDFTGTGPYWMPVAAWLSKNDFWLAGLTCACLATWIAFYVWPRWPAFLDALVSEPKKQ